MNNAEKLETIDQITLIMKHMRDIVAEVGSNFIYKRRTATMMGKVGEYCVYVHDNAPDCLIGKILHRMGIPLAILAELEGSPAKSVCNILHNDGILHLHESAISVLDRAQSMQDNHKSYGTVLEISQDNALYAIGQILES